MASALFLLSLGILVALVTAGPEPIDNYANVNFVASDFLLKNLSSVGKNVFPAGRTHRTSTEVLPGVATLGSAIGITVLKPKAASTLHIHPRATELLYVVSGEVKTGFLNESYYLFENTLNAGGVQVFPRGSIHWFVNVGTTDSVVVQSFDAQNPGAVYLNKAFPKIPISVLTTTFAQKRGVIQSMLQNPDLTIIQPGYP